MAGLLGSVGNAIEGAKRGAARARYETIKYDPNVSAEEKMSAFEAANPHLRPEAVRAAAPKAGTPTWNAGVANAKAAAATAAAAQGGQLTFDPTSGKPMQGGKLLEAMRRDPTLLPDFRKYAELAANQGNKFFAEGDRVAGAGPIVGPTAGIGASTDVLGNVRGDANAVVDMANRMYGGLLGGTEQGAGEAMYASNMAQLEGERRLAAERIQNQQALAAAGIQQQGALAQENAMKNALSLAGSARGGNFGAANAAAMGASAQGTQAANATAQNQLALLGMQGTGQMSELEMAAAAERATAAKEAAYLRAQEIAQARNAMIGAQGNATTNLLNFGNLGVEENRATTEAALKDFVTRMGEKWQNYGIGMGRQDTSANYRERDLDTLIKAYMAENEGEAAVDALRNSAFNRERAYYNDILGYAKFGAGVVGGATGGIQALNAIDSDRDRGRY